jgi:hypothetical protein
MPDHIFVYPFTNRTRVVIPGAVHQLGTADLLIAVYDATPAARTIWFAVDPTSPPVDPVTHDVTLTFPMPETGYVLLRARHR